MLEILVAGVPSLPCQGWRQNPSNFQGGGGQERWPGGDGWKGLAGMEREAMTRMLLKMTKGWDFPAGSSEKSKMQEKGTGAGCFFGCGGLCCSPPPWRGPHGQALSPLIKLCHHKRRWIPMGMGKLRNLSRHPDRSHRTLSPRSLKGNSFRRVLK